MSLLRRVENVLEVRPRRQRLGWLPLLLLVALCGSAFVAVTTGVFDPAAVTVFADDNDDNDEDRGERRERDGDREDPERERDQPRERGERDRERGERDRPDHERGDRERGERDRPNHEHGERRDGDPDGPRPETHDRDRPHHTDPLGYTYSTRDRESSLMQLLMELRREVASLRKEVHELSERECCDSQIRV